MQIPNLHTCSYHEGSKKTMLLLTSNRLAVSSSSSCSSWFLTCDRRSHSLSFSFSSWQDLEKRPHLTRRDMCTADCHCVSAYSRCYNLLCSIQLFPKDLRPLFSDFFFSVLQWGATEPGEVAMVSAWCRLNLASSLHSGLRFWIQIYQTKAEIQSVLVLGGHKDLFTFTSLNRVAIKAVKDCFNDNDKAQFACSVPSTCC